MKRVIRLVVKGFWSVPSIEESTVVLLPSTRARSFGMLQLRDFKLDGKETNNAPAILDYKPFFDDYDNAIDSWTGTKTDFVELPSPFLSGKGISFTRNDYEATGEIALPTFIKPNGAFTIRGYIFKPAEPPEGTIPEGEDTPPHIWQVSWPNFIFQLSDGKPQIVIVAEKNAQIAAGEEVTAHSLAFGKGSDSFYNTPFALTFIPEPSGRVHVILEGSGTVATVDVKSQLEKRTPDILWNNGPLRVICEKGAALWQVGYPRFMTRGAHYTGKEAPVADQEVDLNGHTFYVQADVSGPGTSVIPALDSVQLKTANRRYTPFWYGQWGTREGGERGAGFVDVDWDSADHLDAQGNAPFVAASMQWDGDDESLIVSNHFDLEIRQTDEVVMPGFRFEALENRVVDLYADGVLMLKNGLVARSMRSDVRQVTRNQISTNAYRPNSGAHIPICDVWFVLDEDLMIAMPPGDTLRLGAYLRLLLKGAGFSTAELAGIGAGDGMMLPRAAFGETPLVMPEFGQSRGEFIRSLMERYGMGRRLYWGIDGWNFLPPNQTIVASFTSAASANAPDSGERYIMLDPIDRLHDFGEVYNWFGVLGKEGDAGQPFATWEQAEGIYASGGPGNPRFIGRRKRFLVNDERIRTPQDAAIVARSTAAKRGGGGRGVEFDTYFHNNIFPGAYVLCDGVTHVVKRIPDADIFADKMRLCLREVD